MICRHTGDDSFWTMLFKAKYMGKTKTYVASFEAFNHPHLLSETFVSVRVWEIDNLKNTAPKDLFLADVSRAKTRAQVDTFMQLYEKWKGGENVDV